MGKNRRKKGNRTGEPRVAPGFNDRKFGEDATKEEIERGDSTRVIRVFLDENDPS